MEQGSSVQRNSQSRESSKHKEESKNSFSTSCSSPNFKAEPNFKPQPVVPLHVNKGEKVYLIKDVLTGAVHDVRSQAFDSGAYVDPRSISKQSLAMKDKLNWQLLRASETGDIELAKQALDSLKHGNLIANINTTELNDFTPLHNAVGEGHIEIVKLLINKGANVSAITTEGRTPLHMACYNGNKEIIECLINEGADINKQEKDGNTAVHILAERGWPEALSFLLGKNPDLSIKNCYGLTAPEVSTTVEIQNMFPSLKDEQGYKRTVVDNMILRNNRADMIKAIMFKKQLLAKVTVNEDEEVKIMSKEMAESERMEIIEASRRVKDIMPSEELKSIGPSDFQPIKLLGKGSFGQVYLVKHKSSGKLYALKMLDKEKFISRNIFRYAATERDVLSYIDHPFIVKLHYAFQTAKKLCLVLDYCLGYFFIHKG